MSAIPDRLRALRDAMQANGVSHYLVPSADEHINEYLPPWRERRRYASGFTGSAGDLLVAIADGESWLFTDGRYHVQAAEELRDSGIGLQKVGAVGAKSLLALIGELAGQQRDRFVLGLDPGVIPVASYEALRTAASAGGGSIRPLTANLVDRIWPDRPRPPTTPLIACPLEWTGATVDDKVNRVREQLRGVGADAMVVVKLDQIAWLLNLRSLDDVPYNPVFEAFLYLDPTSIHLFLRRPTERLPAAHADTIHGLTCHEYADFLPFLRQLGPARVLLDPAATTEGVRQALCDNAAIEQKSGDSPIEDAKALKNPAELACMQHANLMASVAKTRALLWLRDRLDAGDTITELRFKDQLEACYAQITGFRGLSFRTISSTGEHGAIIHYGGADDTPLEPGHLFLIDSGIQMDGGTTDDTRTVAVGTPSAEQRARFTAVLRGHIRGANQLFPDGTAGAAIDAITRSALWAEQLHYDHGTGHGVGCFLNVHEGPFGIAETSRRAYASRKLRPGMITSIEPGYYAAAFGGIRIENLYHIRQIPGDGERMWLGFEPLTWIPIDPALIDVDRLDRAERQWLLWYHGECRRRLAPHLTSAEQAMLHAWIGD